MGGETGPLFNRVDCKKAWDRSPHASGKSNRRCRLTETSCVPQDQLGIKPYGTLGKGLAAAVVATAVAVVVAATAAVTAIVAAVVAAAATATVVIPTAASAAAAQDDQNQDDPQTAIATKSVVTTEHKIHLGLDSLRA